HHRYPGDHAGAAGYRGDRVHRQRPGLRRAHLHRSAPGGHLGGGEPGARRDPGRDHPGHPVRPAVLRRPPTDDLTRSPMMSSASNDDVRIRLEGLTKRYPGQRSNAVDALDLDIRRGEVVVLVGPSGCGKTTTMKMINRII